MKEKSKTKERLIDELGRQITGLKRSEAECKQAGGGAAGKINRARALL